MNIDFSGKCVIVIGVLCGIGWVIVLVFVVEGVWVVICVCSEEVVVMIGWELEIIVQVVIVCVVDVIDIEGVKVFVVEVVVSWGGVDVLVNNVGQGKGGNLDILILEDIFEYVNILQMGYFCFVQVVVLYMCV